MLEDRYLRPNPSKRARTQQDEDSGRRRIEKILKKKLQRDLGQELQLYFQETMDLMSTSPEWFALCAAQGKQLYAWMAELLKTDPDCLEELQGIQTDLAFMNDMLDKVRYDLSKASKLGGA